ncbi:hypothetical protein GCM10027612_86500 [Microbispora bryophytorum subsp. camponoti]
MWCRVHGEELVIVGRDLDGDGAGHGGLKELWRHALSTPGRPRIVDEHYPEHDGGNGPKAPGPRPQSKAEQAFLAIGSGAEAWLIEAAATGVPRIRAKMARAVELAALLGADRVDEALGLAAINNRFAEADLASICDHLAVHASAGEQARADESHSAQPGTASWAALRTTSTSTTQPTQNAPTSGKGDRS